MASHNYRWPLMVATDGGPSMSGYQMDQEHGEAQGMLQVHCVLSLLSCNYQFDVIFPSISLSCTSKVG